MDSDSAALDWRVPAFVHWAEVEPALVGGLDSVQVLGCWLEEALHEVVEPVFGAVAATVDGSGCWGRMEPSLGMNHVSVGTVVWQIGSLPRLVGFQDSPRGHTLLTMIREGFGCGLLR